MADTKRELKTTWFSAPVLCQFPAMLIHPHRSSSKITKGTGVGDS